LGFRQADIWWRQSARILSGGRILWWMAADKESCRPDFAVALYPGHLWNWTYAIDPKFELNPDVPFTRETPPTLLLQAEDDPVDDVNHSLVYMLH